MHTSTLHETNYILERMQTYFEVRVSLVSSSLPTPHCSPCSCPKSAWVVFAIVFPCLGFRFPFALAAEVVRFSLLLAPVSFHQQWLEVHWWRTHGNGYLLPPDLSVITILCTFYCELQHLLNIMWNLSLIKLLFYFMEHCPNFVVDFLGNIDMGISLFTIDLS